MDRTCQSRKSQKQNSTHWNCPNTPTTVLMPTFKNDPPENRYILMNTVRTTKIFTVRLRTWMTITFFHFLSLRESWGQSQLCEIVQPLGGQWNAIQTKGKTLQIVQSIFLSRHQIEQWCFQIRIKADICF